MSVAAVENVQGAAWGEVQRYMRKVSPAGRIAAEDVLSFSEKSFFDKALKTRCSNSPELFSTSGIKNLNAQEMSYWSAQLHNMGYTRTGGYDASASQPHIDLSV